MTPTNYPTIIILSAYIAVQIFTFYFVDRSHRVRDYRTKWRGLMNGRPEALAMFEKRIPSFRKMLWSFKRLKDSNWIPAEIRAAKYIEALDPEIKAAFDVYIKKGGKV